MAHSRLNPLLRWARARQAAAEQPDFGDHGTAFGMELSMAPGSGTPDPGEAGAAAAEPAPASPLAPRTTAPVLHDGTRGLWRRVSGRRAWRDG
jgi:hypothetical protein